MGRRGPRPQPTALRVLRGNPGKRPLNADEPKPASIASIAPPVWLDPTAAEAWRELAPRLQKLGLLTELDQQRFSMLCIHWSRWRRLCEADPMGTDPAWIRGPHDARATLRGCRFDEAAPRRVRNFLERFTRLGTARWAGDPFVMQEWQWRDHFGPLYGWRRPDGRRRHRRSSVWVPKKNGKTEVAALQSLYHALGDGEPNPHVAIAAVDRFQASICFDAAARIARRSPAVAMRLEVLDSRKRIIVPATDGRIEALSADAEQKEGLNLSFLMLDELHAWKDPDFMHALMYAGAAREEPLVQTISTAGIRLDGGIGWEQFKYADGVRKGEIDDDTWHVAIFAADPEDEWTDPATWRKANPAIGITVTEEELAEQCRIAQQSPSLESAFKRYRLNVWVSSLSQAVDITLWTKNDVHPVTEQDFEGAARVYGGLDLGGTSDLSAYVQLKPCSQDPGAIDLLVRCWLPQGALQRSRNAHLYQQWARDGHLALMPGAVQDYQFITAQILSDAERWTVESIGMDRLFQGLAVANALNDAGMKVFPVAQTFAGLGPLWREFERLLLAGRVHHAGHPILHWAIQQLELITDSAGNRKPTRDNPNIKIDPVMAALFAIDRHARMTTEQPPQRSVYEERGLEAW